MGAILLSPMGAPPNRQASLGLSRVATLYQNQVPPEWEGGFAFSPETCDHPQIVAIDCGTGVTWNRMNQPGVVNYAPAAIWAGSSCSTLTGPSRDTVGRAERALTGSQWWAIEKLLWTGDAESDSPADGTVRPHLADGSATVLAGSGDVAEGVARLDQFLTDCLQDSPGVIHMAPVLFSRAYQKRAITYEGGQWITPLGHLVVGGGGYTGQAARSAGVLPAAPNLLADPIPASTIYATGPVFYLIGDVHTTAETVREVNDQSARSERAAAVFYAPCCHGSTLVAAET